jgi:hypothetical protein
MSTLSTSIASRAGYAPLVAFLIFMGSTKGLAQSASNTCGYNAGNQYPVGTSCSLQSFNKPSTFTATFTPVGNTCGSGNFDDAWGWFTATGTTTNITFDPSDSHQAIVHVFSGPCTALTQVGCVNSGSNGTNATLSITTVPGTNYMIRVQRSATNSSMSGNLCIWSPVPNDSPCTATPLPLTGTCNLVASSNVGATQATVPAAPSCGGYTTGSGDVWFSFVAGPLGTVAVQSQAGSLTDGAMAVYIGGSCSGTLTEIACDDDTGPELMPFLQLSNLTPGQTYYVRFWGFGSAAGTFSICAQGVTTLPAGNCVYVLNMYDSFGNGWGTSSVGISINGGPYQLHTVTGAFNQVVFGVNIGNIVAIQYNNSGTFQDQNRYTLSLAGGLLFNSGSPPVNGLVYTALVTCQPPPPLQEDCMGGPTLCSAQAFSNAATSTGAISDLNPSNSGCLNALERQGTWYNFSITAPGTVGLTIAPTDPDDDYDFAIWGPFPPGSNPSTICPPLGAPLRCSYSGLTGNTGLSTTATDLSEGAGGDKWLQRLTVTTGQVYLIYISNYSVSGLAFNLSWQLGGGASLDCTILPVELVELRAEPLDGHVGIFWTTATESGTSHFVVERIDATDQWVPVASVPAAGHAASSTSYSTRDLAPLLGQNKYRLRMVDQDGSTRYSEVVLTEFEPRRGIILSRPNPAQGRTEFLVRLDNEEKHQLTITAMDGRRLSMATIPTGVGTHEVALDLTGVAAGSYLALLQNLRGELLGIWRLQVE